MFKWIVFLSLFFFEGCSIGSNGVEMSVISYRRGYVQAIIDINMNYAKKPESVTVTGNFTLDYLRLNATKRANEWRKYLLTQ